MNSKVLKHGVLLTLWAFSDVAAHKLDMTHQSHLHSEGIFDRMTALVTAEDNVAKERHEATLRKQQ